MAELMDGWIDGRTDGWIYRPTTGGGTNGTHHTVPVWRKVVDP